MSDVLMTFMFQVTLADGAEPWLKHVLELDESKPEQRAELLQQLNFDCCLSNLFECADLSTWPNFHYKLEEGKLTCAAMRSEGEASLPQLSVLLQTYLQKFDPKKKLFIVWYVTPQDPECSDCDWRGAGCMIITAKKMKDVNFDFDQWRDDESDDRCGHEECHLLIEYVQAVGYYVTVVVANIEAGFVKDLAIENGPYKTPDEARDAGRVIADNWRKNNIVGCP